MFATLGPLDVLINNAGIYPDEGVSIVSISRELRTDMGGSDAPRAVEEGADTAVWLATEADQNLTGKFFRNRKEIGW